MDVLLFLLYISTASSFKSVFKRNAAMWVSNIVVSVIATITIIANTVAGKSDSVESPATLVGVLLFVMTFANVYYASYATNCDIKTAVEKLFRRKK